MSIVEKFMTMEYGPAPEDPREALAWLDRNGRRFGHFINGTWQAPAAGTYFETTDPSTGEKLATVAQGSAADVDSAVKAARAALPAWQSLTPHARARMRSERLPSWQSGARSFHGTVNIRRRSLCHGCEFFARGRIRGLEVSSCRGRLPSA